MSKRPSPPAERVMTLSPGKSCVVARNPRGLIATAMKYVEARYSVARAEGQFVIRRIA
jgi:hypothetical protein